ncbi:hypothetical protein HWV62_44673 [Athelia sp. TMB]|nr:hypothetical protein HWV62_44673 [Athelia sp. TMB]
MNTNSRSLKHSRSPFVSVLPPKRRKVAVSPDSKSDAGVTRLDDTPPSSSYGDSPLDTNATSPSASTSALPPITAEILLENPNTKTDGETSRVDELAKAVSSSAAEDSEPRKVSQPPSNPYHLLPAHSGPLSRVDFFNKSESSSSKAPTGKPMRPTKSVSTRYVVEAVIRLTGPCGTMDTLEATPEAPSPILVIVYEAA